MSPILAVDLFPRTRQKSDINLGLSNQQESQSLSQNVRLGIQFRYQAGKVIVNHNRFLGYTKDEDGKLIIDENEAIIIKRIYREYLEGSSLQDICDSLMADGILTGAGKESWIPSTVHKILTNEKYIGDALLQKTITTDFLEKKRIINNGVAPQYYVEGCHDAIISRDIYMRVQEEMVRRANLRSGSEGKKKRIYSSKYALSSLCTCEKCGDIYRRIAWNNRGKHSIVWRCCTRVNNGPKACDAPTISEENLQGVVMRAINEVLGSKSTVIEDMKAILETMDSGSTDTRLAEIEQELADIQQELITLATANKDYDDLADKVISLREEKNALLTEKAEENGRVLMREDLMTFLDEQTAELTEYDEQLVRRLIENIIIRTDGTYKIEFKSGTTIEL